MKEAASDYVCQTKSELLQLRIWTLRPPRPPHLKVHCIQFIPLRIAQYQTMPAACWYPADVRSATDVVAVHGPCDLLAALGAELHALVIDRDVRVHGDDGAVGGVEDFGVDLLIGVVGGDQAYLAGLGAGEERFGARRFDGGGEAHLMRDDAVRWLG